MTNQWRGTVRAPAFPDGLLWLNGGPVQWSDLRGKAVVLDFWTYG